MYLLIHEDGSLQTAEKLEEDIFKSADDGYVDIIDVSNKEPLQYYENEWHKIDNIEENHS